MNKNSKKTKGFSKRLLVLMLCCFCLLATMPISAVALETGESQITEENTLEQQSENTSESLQPVSSDIAESVNDTDDQQDTSTNIVEPVTENETDTEVGSEVDTESGIVTETGTESDIETENMTETETVSGNETGTETETSTETETEIENGTGAETEDELGTEADIETETRTETETELEPVETEPNYLEQLNDYYNQAVAVGSGADNSVYAEIYNGTMAVYAAAGSPSSEDDPDVYNAVGMIVMTLQGYGYDPYAVSQLAESRKQSFYKGDCDVYWDATDGTSGLGETHIESITLNGLPVTWGDSDLGSGWSGTPSQVEDYYNNATKSSEQTVKLSVTPEDGYYVTRITVVCCPRTLEPYKCSTWSEGLAYDQEMTISAGGTLTIDLSSVAFCHDSNEKEDQHQYFILVQVAPLPSPLYVEYDYGEIVNILNNANLATTPFDAPNTWTSVGSASDYYGSFTETDTLKFKQTEYTQYMYRYAEGDEDDAADWSHTSNYVTEAAKLAAANAGYYFSHWEAQYYEKCAATAITDPTYNNYTYSFSDEYGNPVVYSEGVDVSMVTNIRLVAQWKPIELKVTKTVDGLSEISEFTSNSQTYQLVLQNLQSGEYVTLQTTGFTIAGDGSLTYTYAASGADVTRVITPGTYKIVETGSYDLTGSTDNAYCTTTYPIETVEVAADGTVKELQVLNTYSSTPATYDLTVQKTVSGNMYDSNKEFVFTVTYGEETVTFNLTKDGTNTIEGIPVGAAVTVSEVPDGYTYTFVSITDGVAKEDITNGVSFTMPAQDVTVIINNEKNVTVDTGILLDTLPYILILGTVAVGAVLLIKKRRNRDDD